MCRSFGDVPDRSISGDWCSGWIEEPSELGQLVAVLASEGEHDLFCASVWTTTADWAVVGIDSVVAVAGEGGVVRTRVGAE